MEKNIIFYFSGTGNSLRVANIIAQKIGDCGIINIAKYSGSGKDKFVLDGIPARIGFVFPCYAFGLPNMMTQFIKSLELSSIRSAYFFAVATCGGGAGNCLGQVQELLSSKRLDLTYGAVIKMFANCITLYKMADTAWERAIESDKEAQKVAGEIADLKGTGIPKQKGILNLAYKFMSNSFTARGKNYRASDACIGCGNCVKICPANNITLQNDKPQFGDKCEQCMACIQWCPMQAINYKSKTQNSGRYHHPNISYEDMVK
ncbi:flavodoxin [Spirochaetia bacterium]|nr:flavodoxin [Spirochaetia bacterium]GHV21111.1 flavodoxin [Spirochaetia bacterium]